MEFDNATNDKIEELQMLESQLQSFLAQKQNVQIEFNEVENAIEELKNSNDEVYKIVSGIMIKSDKEKINKELAEKKKILEMRMKSLERQEELLQKNSFELRNELSKNMSKENKIIKK